MKTILAIFLLIATTAANRCVREDDDCGTGFFELGQADCDDGEKKCVNIPTSEDVLPEGILDQNKEPAFDSEVIKKNRNDAETAEKPVETIARSFSIGPFGRPPPALCKLPKPFPLNCLITRNERFGEEPPDNIPYCQRIPCSKNNAPLDNNKMLCHSQPGCYFDYQLWYYRRVFGNSLYPGVPVCQMAIRNRKFHEKARKLRRWSSYYTNCLLQTYEEEIYEPTAGCQMLPLLRALGQYPKQAGWKNIQKKTCIHINGCWEEGDGCYYEIKLNLFKVKSLQFASENRRSRDEMTAFGRSQCQRFNTQNPATILHSIHKCLASGCTVDKRVWMQYNDLFWYVGSQSPAYVHNHFMDGVTTGSVGCDNFESMTDSYSKMPHTAKEDPSSSFDPFAISMNMMPNMPPIPQGFPNMPSMGNPNFGNIVLPTQFQRPMQECMMGMRTCPGSDFMKNGRPGRYVFSKFCPYKKLPFTLPQIGPLKGSIEGCCDDPALCYNPKEAIIDCHSGMSAYYGRWGPWGKCDKECGGGRQYRYRRCTAVDKSECDDGIQESRSCNNHRCAYWSEFGSWGSCSKSCGGGQQRRYRKCEPNNIESECKLDPLGAVQTRICNINHCVEKYTAWEPWIGTCEPCGTIKRRERRCQRFETCDRKDLIEIQQCQNKCGECQYHKNSRQGRCEYDVSKGECYKTTYGECSTSACNPPCRQQTRCQCPWF